MKKLVTLLSLFLLIAVGVSANIVDIGVTDPVTIEQTSDYEVNIEIAEFNAIESNQVQAKVSYKDNIGYKLYLLSEFKSVSKETINSPMIIERQTSLDYTYKQIYLYTTSHTLLNEDFDNQTDVIRNDTKNPLDPGIQFNVNRKLSKV